MTEKAAWSSLFLPAAELYSQIQQLDTILYGKPASIMKSLNPNYPVFIIHLDFLSFH